MQPKLSVILPFYNTESTLEKAIQSIVNQSFKDFELLLIDNGSIDSSHKIAEEFKATDSRIHLLNEEARGVVFAANKGLSLAKGMYIARMDADDISVSDRFERQVHLLDENEEIGVVSGLVEYAGLEPQEGFLRYIDWSNSILSPEKLYLNQFVEYPIVNPTLMFRRTLYEQYGGYLEGNFPEDYEFFLRLQSHRVKMQKVGAVVLEWNDLEGRLTRTDDRYSTESFFKLKAKYLTSWLERNNPNHPNVVVWGAGKEAKKRSSFLKENGVNIHSFIDIKKTEETSFIYYEDVEVYKGSFILSFVASWNAREKIREHLNQQGFVEGVNYLICA